MYEPRCASCKFFDLGYNDNGFMSDGFCEVVLPPSLRQPKPEEPNVSPSDDCTLHQRAIDADIASRRMCWPKDASRHIDVGG